jgi:hypothetical protein
VLVVTASASLPPTAAAAAPAPKSPPSGDEPDRDPQARGARPLYAAELPLEVPEVPEDRDGSGVSERVERTDGCADPERLEGCARQR